jgi:hypothetical protein
MKDKIETFTKKAQQKNANQKDIKLLNSGNEVTACLVELLDKECDEDFSTLAAVQEYMEEKEMIQKKQRANDSSEEEYDEEKVSENVWAEKNASMKITKCQK